MTSDTGQDEAPRSHLLDAMLGLLISSIWCSLTMCCYLGFMSLPGTLAGAAIAWSSFHRDKDLSRRAVIAVPVVLTTMLLLVNAHNILWSGHDPLLAETPQERMIKRARFMWERGKTIRSRAVEASGAPALDAYIHGFLEGSKNPFDRKYLAAELEDGVHVAEVPEERDEWVYVLKPDRSVECMDPESDLVRRILREGQEVKGASRPEGN